MPPPPKKSKKAKSAASASQGGATISEIPTSETKAAVNGDKAASSENAQTGAPRSSGTSTPASKDKAKEQVKRESDKLAELD